MAEHLQVGTWRHRPVGQHHIQLVHRERTEQGFEAILVTHQLDLLRQLQGGFQQARGNQFRQRIRDTHRQAHDLRGVRMGQRILHLLGQGKNLFGIPERDATGISQHQTPSLGRQQHAPDCLVEQAELGADGLDCDIEPFGSARQAAFLGDHPEIIKVAQIQSGGFHRFLSLARAAEGHSKMLGILRFLRRYLHIIFAF